MSKDLYILSTGSAYPENTIDNKTAISICSTYEDYKDLNISKRNISLNLDYIKDTKNSNVELARSNSDITPTELAVIACKQAIEKANINIEDIGLVIGETITPNQLIPGESHRVCRDLGLKVQSYDITASSASQALYFETILNWKDEFTPEYILCFSTNIISHYLDYSKPESFLFTDAASAMLISTKKGGYKVNKALFQNDNENIFNISPTYHAKIDKINDLPNNNSISLLKEYSNHDYIVSPYKTFHETLANNSIDKNKLNYDFAYSFGAYPACVLNNIWGKEKILINIQGLGLTSGYIEMEKV